MNPDDLRALQEQAHQLEELTRHPGWAVFVDYCQFGPAMLGDHQTRLLSGGCKTPEDYQHYAGWVQGCSAAVTAPVRVRAMSDKHSQETGEPLAINDQYDL